MTDLFGNEIVEPPKVKRGGYAAPPGSGPKGETCRTCKHYVSLHWRPGRNFPKCGLMHRHWNHSYGSDILARSPACRFWTMKDPVQWREKIPLNEWDNTDE